jgi:hypothetical protein
LSTPLQRGAPLSEISFESDADVEAALNAAALADETPPVEQAPAPVVETPPAGEVADPAATAEQPEPVVPAEDSPSLFDGTAVNPDELIAQHPELEPFVKQLTATFTRKTQGVAEQRKELEALGSVEDLQQAAQLYQRMSDPSNWPEIHARLTEALEEQGLTPAQASVEAARQMGAEQPSPEELPDDPELQPFVKELQAQRAELAQLRAERNAEVQQAAAERERQSMINDLQAAETAIRQANDNYEQQDIDMVYKLGSFHEADLHKSQADLEEYVQGRIARYIASKQTPTSVAPAPAHAANSTTVPSNDRSLEDVAAESTEYLRGLVASGEVSLDGI